MSFPASSIWTEDDARLLLQNPIKLFLKEDRWRIWVFKRGGLPSVYDQLLKLDFSSSEQEIVNLIISAPGLDAKNYAMTLSVDRATYYRHLKSLVKKLAIYLNAGALDLIEPVPVLSESSFQGIAPNVPVPVYPIIGRNDLVQSVYNLLVQPDVRLITLTGPGGIGKTRLALHLAHQLHTAFRDGVVFVQLAAIRDTGLVISAIAQAVGISEAGSSSLMEHLKSYFNDKHLLLILDNFEQLMPAGEMIGELITYTPYLHVLITSREVLHIYGEQEYPVPALEFPDIQADCSIEKLAGFSSVALFVQRASAVNQKFRLTEENAAAVVEICKRLDGLPLAIELITARAKYFSPQALLARLQSSSLALLTNGPQNLPTRQQTLRAAIEWSYKLLSFNEQRLFSRMAVFRGGCTIDAVEKICKINNETNINNFDILMSLSAKSLLQQREDQDGEPRFFMLGTLREYAFEQLSLAKEDGELQYNHAIYYLSFVEEAELQLIGPNQVIWLDLLEKEHGNIQAVLEWSIIYQQIVTMFKMSSSLWRFWRTRGYITEGRYWLEQVLSLKDYVEQRVLLAKVLDASGILAMAQVDYDLSRSYHEQSLEIYRILGDKKGVSGNLESLAMICMHLRDYERSFDLFSDSLQLRRDINDLDGISSALTNLANVSTFQEEYTAAIAYVEEALEIDRKIGNLQAIVCNLCNIGAIAYFQQDYLKSYKMYKEALIMNQDIADMDNNALCLEGIALSFAFLNRVRQSAVLFGAASKIRSRYGLPPHTANNDLITTIVDKGRSLIGSEWDSLWLNGNSRLLNDIVNNFIINSDF
jgi:predicted ATPase